MAFYLKTKTKTKTKPKIRNHGNTMEGYWRSSVRMNCLFRPFSPYVVMENKQSENWDALKAEAMLTNRKKIEFVI